MAAAFTYSSQPQAGVVFREGIAPDSSPVADTLIPLAISQTEALEPGNPRLLELEQAIADYQTQNRENVYLFIEDETRSYGSGSDNVTRSASLIKITVMIEVYRQLESGELTPETRVSRYGFSGTVSQALTAMMHRSDNSATGALIQSVGGTESVNNTIRELLGETAVTTLHHTPGFYSEPGASKPNVTTAREQVQLIRLLEEGLVVTPERSAEMLELMAGTRDYFGVRSIDGIDSISFKTGYFPDFLFGLTGSVTQDDGGTFRFCIIVEDWKNGAAKWSGIRELLTLMTEYATIE
ncbi:MAG: hypothetical protein TR69_WS6001000388 [candidate division WS6 bacterium OLB20]|uniref:Beta-lactamase class A catalytic domain-containing protein n=1 Tax=candidate division WS6 bacterium OLB20 TaxID=1617426 RepID=A0A136LXL6_9BACT|nr:MAG: hypothetical protein TR69_WS6001000388 [candidate division WS6 bacterium OLB20]